MFNWEFYGRKMESTHHSNFFKKLPGKKSTNFLVLLEKIKLYRTLKNNNGEQYSGYE